MGIRATKRVDVGCDIGRGMRSVRAPPAVSHGQGYNAGTELANPKEVPLMLASPSLTQRLANSCWSSSVVVRPVPPTPPNGQHAALIQPRRNHSSAPWTIWQDAYSHQAPVWVGDSSRSDRRWDFPPAPDPVLALRLRGTPADILDSLTLPITDRFLVALHSSEIEGWLAALCAHQNAVRQQQRAQQAFSTAQYQREDARKPVWTWQWQSDSSSAQQLPFQQYPFVQPNNDSHVVADLGRALTDAAQAVGETKRAVQEAETVVPSEVREMILKQLRNRH